METCENCGRTVYAHFGSEHHCDNGFGGPDPKKVFTPQLSKEEQTEGEKHIIERMVAAQYGEKDQVNAIEKHMAEYFTRWPAYKEKFTHLEWYHIFLDFLDSLPASSLSRVEGERDELRKERDELLLIVRASYQEAVNEGYISEMRFLQPTIEKYASQSTTPLNKEEK